ncbi:MAG TPA: UDP-glucose--hexose-1-phosphate uridylyltransferase [Longimicrobiales bacterium]
MSASFDPQQPHRRRNALTGEWVLVSPHRMQRPWQGRVEKRAPENRPAHDPSCYLCPGNERAGGERNPDYHGAWAFTNDFAALTASSFRLPASRHGDDDAGLLEARAESGTSRVICFSPRHDLTLPEMSLDGIRAVVDLWAREYEELAARDDVAWVQIFENKGELMGCSNPHPHGQIWAQSSIPGEPAKEDATQRAHFEQHGRTLLADYLALELEQRERIVVENDAFVALVPFWAVWPFELLVVSREPRASILDLSDAERTALADMLKRVTTRYDNLFETSFPYSMGIHQLPASGFQLPDNGDTGVEAPGRLRRGLSARSSKPEAFWHFHMHFYPPLLRSATVRKFMVGYEMLGEPQRDLTPEAAAQRLRDVSEVHYRQGSTP